MCTKSELTQILEKMIKVYCSTYKDNVQEIYLYGSYARGDYTSESDIDMVAIVKGNRETLQQQLKEIWNIASDISLDYEVVVSPTVIPYDEFENYKNILPYYRNIMEEGVRLSA
jgi:predicted nucleotidyltransferase